MQYKLEATPEPSDEDEDESEEEEEDDDMFGGGKGADDPAAQAASEPTDKQNNKCLTLYYLEAKALAEKQAKEALAMAQSKCSVS